MTTPDPISPADLAMRAADALAATLGREPTGVEREAVREWAFRAAHQYLILRAVLDGRLAVRVEETPAGQVLVEWEGDDDPASLTRTGDAPAPPDPAIGLLRRLLEAQVMRADGPPGGYLCVHCGGPADPVYSRPGTAWEIRHRDDCPWVEAKRFLEGDRGGRI